MACTVTMTGADAQQTISEPFSDRQAAMALVLSLVAALVASGRIIVEVDDAPDRLRIEMDSAVIEAVVH